MVRRWELVVDGERIEAGVHQGEGWGVEKALVDLGHRHSGYGIWISWSLMVWGGK